MEVLLDCYLPNPLGSYLPNSSSAQYQRSVVGLYWFFNLNYVIVVVTLSACRAKLKANQAGAQNIKDDIYWWWWCTLGGVNRNGTLMTPTVDTSTILRQDGHCSLIICSLVLFCHISFQVVYVGCPFSGAILQSNLFFGCMNVKDFPIFDGGLFMAGFWPPTFVVPSWRRVGQGQGHCDT